MYFLRRKPETVKRNILHAGHEIITCARTIPKSKCVVVIGEFAGDIGISFKVDMDFVRFVDGGFRWRRGESEKVLLVKKIGKCATIKK